MAETENTNALPFELEDYIDEVEEDNSPENKHLRGKEGFELLALFIGGFEHWPLLIDDCKRKVVEFLDYKSRCMLARCSKSDHELVESIPIRVDGIDLVDNEGLHPELQRGSLEILESVVIRVVLNKDNPSRPKYFELVFSQQNADTLIRWVANKLPRGITVPNRNYREQSCEFFENWLKKCQFGVKELTVEMSEYPFESSQIKCLPNCKKLRLGSDNLDVFKWWLQKCPEQLDSLELLSYEMENETFVLTPEFLELPHILSTASFQYYCKAGFTDEQFARLKARRMVFDPTRITEDGLNMFLRKWARGEGSENFVKAILWTRRDYDEQKVMEGLRLRPWDEEFRREARGFCNDYDRCCGVGSCYQVSSYVEPYSSLTVGFYPDRFCIYATGKKWIVNGNEATDYSVVV